MANSTKTTTGGNKKPAGAGFRSSVTVAFIMVSLVVIVIVILVYPAATGAVIAIMGAAPAFLNALAAFIVALHSHSAAATGKALAQEQPASTSALPSDKNVN